MEEMEFWDKELIRSGCYIMLGRWKLVEALREKVEGIHFQLTNGKERLELSYLPSLGKEALGEIEKAFKKALEKGREREITLGMTLFGPHRDELRFTVSGVDMGVYGSRGQARTIALSLKLAEGGVLYNQRGDSPILLLDDVLSEMDASRRRQLAEAISPYEQAIITTTDWGYVEPSLLSKAHKWQIREGNFVSF
jgi:DNA replication and repair protein RecF